MADVLLAAATPPVLTDPAASAKARDTTEERLSRLFSQALQAYLTRVRLEVTGRLAAPGVDPSTVLLAAGQPDPITLGEMAGWWSAIVDARMVAAVQQAYRTALGHAVPESGLVNAMDDYLPRVRDRLVRGIQPPIAEDSFDKVRTVLARSTALGNSRTRTAEQIALELGWAPDRPRINSELNRVNSQIDRLLDPLGPPGTPAREQARLGDPRIAALQAQRSSLVLRLDEDESHWQARAKRIARTEATALNGYGADRALAAEGWTHKKWVATHDARTREDHRNADGQVVEVGGQFTVGGYALKFPGDPSAPAEEVINCRCTVVGLDREPASPAPAAEPATVTSIAPTPSERLAADLSDDELEAEVGSLMTDPDAFDSPRLEQLAYEMDKRDAARQASRALQEEAAQQATSSRVWRRSGEKALRDEYETFIEVQYVAAEQELNGVLLSREGRALADRGELDPRDLFTRRRRSLRWASEELREWFSRNPRMSFPEFRAGSTLDDVGRAARARAQGRGWESEFG